MEGDVYNVFSIDLINLVSKNSHFNIYHNRMDRCYCIIFVFYSLELKCNNYNYVQFFEKEITTH